MQVYVRSKYVHIGQMPYFQEPEIKSEPMLFSASWDFARKHGGPIAAEFLDRIATEVRQPVIIDSRVHMLMPCWFPCIPGWHLDDVPRTRPDGQPDHINPIYKSNHVCTVIGSASLPQFAEGQCDLEDVPVYGGMVYGKWNRDINDLISQGQIEASTINEGNIIAFNWQTFHRGMAATKNGWRMFIRASWDTQREIKNEIRTQTQIYLPAPEAGW